MASITHIARLRRGVTRIVFVAALLAGCRAIVGIDDRTVSSQSSGGASGEAGSGGSMSSGGQSGGSGAAATGGASSTGGSAGTATGGNAGSGGVATGGSGGVATGGTGGSATGGTAGSATGGMGGVAAGGAGGTATGGAGGVATGGAGGVAAGGASGSGGAGGCPIDPCSLGTCRTTLPAGPNLELWLRAEDLPAGSVGAWTDHSGAHPGASQSLTSAQPVTEQCAFGAFPAAHFRGDDYMELTGVYSDFTGGISAFVVAKPESTGQYARFFELAQGTFNHNIVFSRFESTTSLFAAVYVPVPGNPGMFTGWPVTSGTGVVTNDELHLYYFEVTGGLEGQPTPGVSRRDGQVVGTGTTRVPEIFARGINYLGRSSWHLTSDDDYVGRIGEVIIYNSNLSDTDRMTVEAYLFAKFGISP